MFLSGPQESHFGDPISLNIKNHFGSVRKSSPEPQNDLPKAFKSFPRDARTPTRASRTLPTAPESAPEGAQPSLLRAPRSSPALQKPVFSLRKTLISHFGALPTFCERAAADCTHPPGTLGDSSPGRAPAPGPGETTFTYCFQPSFL